jgi:hypothetical protein
MAACIRSYYKLRRSRPRLGRSRSRSFAINPRVRYRLTAGVGEKSSYAAAPRPYSKLQGRLHPCDLAFGAIDALFGALFEDEKRIRKPCSELTCF